MYYRDETQPTILIPIDALAFLAEQRMVVIQGDQLSIPPRFQVEFLHAPSSGGPILVVSTD